MEFDQLGPYRIIRKRGSGGMGTVYEGIHVDTGLAAAIKLLVIPLAQDAGFRERFEAEIETLHWLKHPNIVRLFGFGEERGHLYYAMELVDGGNLEEELRSGRRFDWREVTQIGIETCQALRHAHDRGIIHRDIKPANLLLTDDGHVKLADFGIARLFGQIRLTHVGGIIGTAEFMAPEQACGESTTPRSDLYSLGVVLYVLLTQRPLFAARSAPEILHSQCYDEPTPINQCGVDVPAGLAAIVMQLLQKDPEKRIRNATLVAKQLAIVEQSLSLDTRTQGTILPQDEPPTKPPARLPADPSDEGNRAEFSETGCQMPEHPAMGSAAEAPPQGGLPATRLLGPDDATDDSLRFAGLNGDGPSRLISEEIVPVANWPNEESPTAFGTDLSLPYGVSCNGAATDPNPAEKPQPQPSNAEVTEPPATAIQPKPQVPNEPSRPEEPNASDDWDEPEVAEPTATESRPPGHATRFTPVAEEELDRADGDDRRTAMISLQTIALAMALIGAGLTAWYLLQPPSPDWLYGRIATAAHRGTTESLLSVEGEIDKFMQIYPEDSRCTVLRTYEVRIDLYRLERQFERRARGLAGTDNLTPIEMDYLEAIRHIQLDRGQGIARLTALLDLYGQGRTTSGPTGMCLELARRRLAELEQEMADQGQQRLDRLTDRLTLAGELVATDPDQARKMYEATIALYQRKPWADEAVQQARAALDAMKRNDGAKHQTDRS